MIGILTYHGAYNFGANLQVLSSVGYLRKKGLDPIIINWIPQDLEAGYNRSIPKVQLEEHQNFFKEHYPLTRLCRTNEDIVEVIEENNIESIIIGSDALIQHKPLLSRIRLSKKGISIKEKRSNTIYPNPFWGSFLEGVDKKISVSLMSVSSQNTSYKIIRGGLRRRMKNTLLSFDKVTVRDRWTERMVRYLTRGKIQADLTPDPVFSFNQNIDIQLSKEEILRKFNLKDGYILISIKNPNIISESWMKSFGELAARHDLSVVYLSMPIGLIASKSSRNIIPLPLSPLEWYGIIKYSAAYIGENMHPIVVALHNSVPFFSFDSYGLKILKYFVNNKSSKTYDILMTAGFLDNRVSILGRNYSCPEPQEVMDKLLKFDKEKCTTFSKHQVNKYRAMMEELV